MYLRIYLIVHIRLRIGFRKEESSRAAGWGGREVGAHLVAAGTDTGAVQESFVYGAAPNAGPRVFIRERVPGAPFAISKVLSQ